MKDLIEYLQNEQKPLSIAERTNLLNWNEEDNFSVFTEKNEESFIKYKEQLEEQSLMLTPSTKQLAFEKIFRLLLQYHDPILSLHLDTMQVPTKWFIQPWVSDLFADKIEKGLSPSNLTEQLKSFQHTCTFLWDNFLAHHAKGKSAYVMISCFAVALFMMYKHELLQTKDCLSFIQHSMVIPHEFIISLFHKALTIYEHTPLTTKNQIYSIYFPSNDESLISLSNTLSKHIILPLATSELIFPYKHSTAPEHMENHLLYSIIDCRSLYSFDYIRLQHSTHIGSHIKYDKEQIQKAIAKFDDTSGDHFVIFGTGKDLFKEQNLLKLITLELLKKGFAYLSFAPGGFEEVIKYISNNQIKYIEGPNYLARKQEKKQLEEQQLEPSVSTQLKELWNWGYQRISEASVSDQKEIKEEKKVPLKPSEFQLDHDEDDMELDLNTDLESALDALIFSNATFKIEASFIEKATMNKIDSISCDTFQEPFVLLYKDNVLLFIQKNIEQGKHIVILFRSLDHLVKLNVINEHTIELTFVGLIEEKVSIESFNRDFTLTLSSDDREAMNNIVAFIVKKKNAT
mmetsp:Transcript_7562/g.11223  ORF Transcript_7562/g.11223 Transcript_7562/m.11223 type:complete len:571 (+) Transcript_7562:19-1731(+)